MNKVVFIFLFLVLSQSTFALRFYNPEHGRWLNPDPIGVEGGINVYNSTSNNMVNAYSGGLTNSSGMNFDSTQLTEFYRVDAWGNIEKMTKKDIGGFYVTSDVHVGALAHAKYRDFTNADIEIDKAWWISALQPGEYYELEVKNSKILIEFNSRYYKKVGTELKRYKTQKVNGVKTVVFTGDTWKTPGSGVGPNALPKYKNLSTLEHEKLHAARMIDKFNKEFYPIAKEFEDSYYCSEKDAKIVRSFLLSAYELLKWEANFSENEVTHAELDKKVATTYQGLKNARANFKVELNKVLKVKRYK